MRSTEAWSIVGVDGFGKLPDSGVTVSVAKSLGVFWFAVSSQLKFGLDDWDGGGLIAVLMKFV